ncbi:MAG: DUF4118 domain-containing protein [Atopobiaceae bacterium]|nr:DUF4118 domain-containing protein [Atopobiaceae bacterium]
MPSVDKGGVVTVKTGLLPNLVVTAAIQAVTVLVALLLDSMEFAEEAMIVLFVLGVLVTAVSTEGAAYSMVASVLSVLLFNFFIVEPRMSLQAWGPDYPETFAVMLSVALFASYLVAKMRTNARLSMEATVRARNEQMRADLLRSVSHDLRTPLTAIMGNTDILLTNDDALPEETRTRLVQDIHDDATWLTDVVENLLAVTRFDKDRVMLNMRPEVVDEVIEEALRHVRRDASGHTITVTPSDELLLARMDSQVIVQVIVNLVNNALAHTPEGCVVNIATKRMEDEVAVTVSDDGPGVGEGNHEAVFDAFYTAKESLTDGRRGIGLGLALCKTIVEAHGGRIWVEDVEPHGAAFTFTLPLEEVPGDE